MLSHRNLTSNHIFPLKHADLHIFNKTNKQYLILNKINFKNQSEGETFNFWGAGTDIEWIEGDSTSFQAYFSRV